MAKGHSQDGTSSSPPHIIQQVLWILKNFDANPGHSDNLTSLKPSLAHLIHLIWPLYALLAFSSFSLNFWVCCKIYQKRLVGHSPYSYLFTICCVNTISSVVILPTTLYVNLRYFWVLGGFLCYAIPICDSLPEHITMLSLLIMVAERYRLLRYPLKFPFPTLLTILGIIAVSVCVSLPFSIYIKYYDVSEIVQTEGLGLCLQEEKSIHEYIRILFVSLYAFPLLLMALLLIKSKYELDSSAELVATNSVNITASLVNLTTFRAKNQPDPTTEATDVDPSGFPAASLRLSEAQLSQNIADEQKVQKNLTYMVSAVGGAWLPLNIMSFCNLLITEESHKTAAVLDLIYLLLVFIGFLSSVTTPLFTAQIVFGGANGYDYKGLKRRISRSFSTFSRKRNSSVKDAQLRSHLSGNVSLSLVPSG